MTLFKILAISQQRTMNSEKWETNKVTPTAVLPYYLEFLSSCVRRPFQAKPVRLPELMRGWGDKKYRIHRIEYRKENFRERKRTIELFRGFRREMFMTQE